MILLDTNILSAMMNVAPDEVVTITIMEIRAGLFLMPAGRRRDTLTRSLATLLQEKMLGRIAPFDLSAADEAAELMARRKLKGWPGEWRDTMIAGIAVSNRATLATRNTAHFQDLPVPVVNPWKD